MSLSLSLEGCPILKNGKRFESTEIPLCRFVVWGLKIMTFRLWVTAKNCNGLTLDYHIFYALAPLPSPNTEPNYFDHLLIKVRTTCFTYFPTT